MIGFVVLSAVFGLGLAWILIWLWMVVAFKRNSQDAVVAGSMPFLLAGGVIGFAVSLGIVIWLSRSGPKAEERIVGRFVRRRDRLGIYSGAPHAVGMALACLLFPHLERAVGFAVAPYVALGVILAIEGLGLFLYDRISPEYIIPIGVVGWLLLVAGAVVFGFSSIH